MYFESPEHTFELANPIYQHFTGNRPLEGRSLFDALPELRGRGFLELLDKGYKTGEPFNGSEMPLTINSEQGKPEVCYLNVNYQAFKDDYGKREGILVFAYDVTKQVLSRRQLELNAEMIHDLYMNAHAYLCTFTRPTHTYNLVNPSYQKIFGKRVIVNKPILEALPELVGQGFDKVLDTVYETGEIYVGIEILIWLARDEGLPAAERYFNFSYQPIYALDKSITGILVFGYEVTDEVLARKVQKDLATRFLILTEAMPQKVWTADATGRVSYLNKLGFEYTMQTFEQLRDWGWEAIIHPDDIGGYKEAWQRSVVTAKDLLLEQRFLHHHGTYRWHLSLGVPQKDEKGKVLLWLGTHTDIHEQKSQAEELTRRVEERIKTEKLKNEFISMASHELKTPVTSIKGYTQALQQKFKDEGNAVAETYLSKMDKQVDKLTPP